MLQRKPAEDRKTDIVEVLLRLADQDRRTG